MQKKIIIFSVLVVFLFVIKIFLQINNIIVYFGDLIDIKVNGYSLTPKYDINNIFYDAVTLNTKSSNELDLVSSKKSHLYKIKLKKLSKNKSIKVLSLWDKKLYRIRTLPHDFPKYELEVEDEVQNANERYLFVTPMTVVPSPEYRSDSYAIAFKTNGDVVFYHQHPAKYYAMMNFQKLHTSDGKVRYAINVEDPDASCIYFFDCEVFLFDENFKLIKKIRFPNGLNSGGHLFKLFDDNHYILSVNPYEFKYVEHFKKNIALIESYFSEIKDNKELVSFDSGYYPEFLNKYNLINNPEIFPFAETVHINSILIDPSDNNFLVSFAFISSVVKIDRQTGKILWILGGPADMFGLSKEQKFILQHSLSFSHDGYLTVFDNHMDLLFINNVGKDFIKSPSRIQKFKLDEKNLKVVDYQEYKLDTLVPFQGSAYETDKDVYVVSYGRRDYPESFSVEEINTNKKAKILSLKIPEYDTSYAAYIYDSLD